MSARRAPRGGGGGGGYGSTDRSMERSMVASAAEAREARQLVAVQSTVRDVQGQLQDLEASARKGIDAGSDAAQAAARVQQELKTTAKHFFREQARDRDTLRQTEQQLRSELTRIAASSGSRSGTLKIEGKSEGALLEVLQPLVHSMVKETMDRQAMFFCGLMEELTGEVRRIEQTFDDRVDKNHQELKRLRAQVDSVHQRSASVSAQAEGALAAAEDLRAEMQDVLRPMETTVAALNASAAVQMRSVPEPAPEPAPAPRAEPAPTQAEFEAVTARLERLDARFERVSGEQAASERGSMLEKEMVSMIERQIASLVSDLKSGEQQLANVNVKCDALLAQDARNRKAVKKLEAKVDGAQERMDSRLDRLLAQAMQQPPSVGRAAVDGLPESVPPPARSLSAVPGHGAESIALMTPSLLRGSAGASATGAVGAHGGSVWEEHSAVDGRRYYYNTQTGKSEWTRPADMGSPGGAATRPLPASGGGVDGGLLGGTTERIVALERLAAEERNQVLNCPRSPRYPLL
jgi:hypothetical protein